MSVFKIKTDFNGLFKTLDVSLLSSSLVEEREEEQDVVVIHEHHHHHHHKNENDGISTGESKCTINDYQDFLNILGNPLVKDFIAEYIAKEEFMKINLLEQTLS